LLVVFLFAQGILEELMVVLGQALNFHKDCALDVVVEAILFSGE